MPDYGLEFGHERKEMTMRRATTIANSASSTGRPLLLKTCLLVAALVSASPACTGDGRSSSVGAAFWSSLRFSGASEVEHYGSLREMTDSADAVVLGSFSGFGLSRTIQGDAVEDVVVYGQATLVISKTLAGSSYGDSVPLEFIIPATTQESAEKVIADLEGDLPLGDLVVFLRDKGGSEAGLFRVTNSLGLWASTERAALDTPLAEQPPEESGAYGQELVSAVSVSELAELIASYRL